MGDPLDEQVAHWHRWAPHYDGDSEGFLAPADAVDMLTRNAAGGPVLELGVGSGRVAIPLAERGVRVVGVDASPDMIDQLHARRGAAPVTAVVGDMAHIDLPERFTLAYVVASTVFLLGDQRRQVSCFRSVAAVLRPGGLFVVEAALPATLVADGQPVLVRAMDDEHLRLSVHVHDPAAQVVRSQEIRLGADGRWRMLPSVKRYAAPAELDLMAQLAGMQLVDRYADWRQRPFTAAANRHVSVYRLAEGAS